MSDRTEPTIEPGDRVRDRYGDEGTVTHFPTASERVCWVTDRGAPRSSSSAFHLRLVAKATYTEVEPPEPKVVSDLRDSVKAALDLIHDLHDYQGPSIVCDQLVRTSLALIDWAKSRDRAAAEPDAQELAGRPEVTELRLLLDIAEPRMDEAGLKQLWRFLAAAVEAVCALVPKEQP